MPIISQSQIVPPNIPRPTGLDYYGQLNGAMGRQITDALLAALLGGGGGFGKTPTQPTPQRPGQLQFPSGARTNTSPDELAQIQAMGGIPNRQGGTVPFGTGAPNAVSYQPPTKFGIRPNMDWQIKQADLANKQASLVNTNTYTDYLKASTPKPSVDTSGGLNPSDDAGLIAALEQHIRSNPNDEQVIEAWRQLKARQVNATY